MLRRWSPALVIVLALASAACGRDAAQRGEAPAPSGTGLGAGPDGVLLRVARGGGRVSAYRWPRDSAVWKSPSALPGLARVLAFDPEQGALSFVALDGRVGRLELRVGTLTMGVREPLSAITSVDGASVFALDSAGALLRLTAAARWRLPLPTGTDQLFPLPDGSVFALVPHGRNATLLRARPPAPRLRDSVLVRAPQVIVPSPLGDRLWLADADGVRALRTRDLALLDAIRVGGDVRLAVPTPSGDRLLVVTRGRKAITVIDRFAESIATRIELPDEPSALRMDADGRYLLARSARGDSTRIIAIGTSRLVGTVRTLWRDDLPFVAPDGSIALAQGGDLVVVDGETRGEQRRVVGGAEDLWYLVRWNGFRPRAASLDEPVRFEEDSIVGDSSAAEPPAIGPELPPPEPAPAARAPVTAPPAAPAAPARERGFVAAFAPMSTEARARALASLLRSEGNDARVVPVTGEQAQLWRVIVGPFRTRADADRAGRQSGFPYVIAPVDP